MQLLLRHLIFFVCFLCLSCVSISSDVKHSEWMQIKDERKKVHSASDNIEMEVLCEANNYANNVRFTEKFDIYCNEMKKSVKLFGKSFLDNGIYNLAIKVEIFPFQSPSRFKNVLYPTLVIPVVDGNGKVVVSWYFFDNKNKAKTFIYSKEVAFDRNMFFWLFIGFGQYDLIKRIYEDRWYEGEAFGLNLTGFYFPAEFAIILNRRMIQDVLDGKATLIQQSN